MARPIYGTGGISTRRGTLPPTRWNPSGLTTNCGFCAISYALELQKGKLVNADQLYEQTLERLGIDTKGDTDPIPRLLIFPGFGVGEAAIMDAYSELGHRARSPNDYTIWSVARAAGLEFKSGDKLLLQSLVEFAAQISPRAWTLDDFVRARMNRPGFAGRATFDGMKQQVKKDLKGNSIIGSITKAHFVNLSISAKGEMKVFDAQKGSEYKGATIKHTLGELQLFERCA